MSTTAVVERTDYLNLFTCAATTVRKIIAQSTIRDDERIQLEHLGRLLEGELPKETSADRTLLDIVDTAWVGQSGPHDLSEWRDRTQATGGTLIALAEGHSAQEANLQETAEHLDQLKRAVR